MKTLRYAAAVLGLALCVPLFADQGEIQKLIDDGKYSEAVSSIDKDLRDRNTSIRDEYRLLMLKGEAALRAGQRAMAVAAFNGAGRIAADRKEAIAAAANALVAQRATAGAVRIGTQSYPIIETKDRNVAMQKMSDEIRSTQARDLEVALNARTLDPIIKIIPSMLNMFVLEMQATDGNATNAEPVAMKLTQQTQQLIGDELRRVQREIDLTDRNAYEINDWRGWTTRGLTTAQRRSMEGLIPYVDRIRNSVLSARRIAYSLHGDLAPWDRLAADCEDLQQQLYATLNRNY